MALPLSDREIHRLKINFLVKLNEMSKNNINRSIEKSNVFEAITSAYDKDTVMPFIVQELMEDGFIIQGKNENEVQLNRKTITSRKGITLLNIFNEVVNSDETFRIGITLNINGLIVSGKLVGLTAYYRGVSRILQEGDKKNANTWASTFNELIEALPKNEEKDLMSDLIGIRHVCVEDARFYPSGQPIPTNVGTYWIGLVESVDGFSMGIFGTAPENNI